MGKHEKRARELKAQGNNRSYSLYTAFMEDKRLDGKYPEPRSIDGKCGALLTAIRILEETGHEDKIEEVIQNRCDPHFKPDYAPDTLACHNYITHFVVVKKK